MASPHDPDSSRSPAIARRSRRTVVLFACGLIVAGLLLLVLVNLDRGTPAPEPLASGPITELIEPRALSEADLAAGRGATMDDAIGNMPAGGWIQITGPDGRLAQQYRFRSLDPDPPGMGPGWIRLTEPELEIYGERGSVVRLRGDSALAYTPNRAVESGTLTGHVVIERYEGLDDRTLDPSRDEVTLLVRTAEARFDNILGDVRCDGDIDLETPSGAFAGRGLHVLFNDQDGVIQRLEVTTVHAIRLAAAPAGAGAATGATGSRAAAAAPAAAPDSASGAGQAPDAPPPGASPASSSPPPTAAAAAPATFYLLTMHDGVEITQGRGEDARRAHGERLHAVFTEESEGIAAVLALAPAPPVTAIARIEPRAFRTLLAGMVMAAVPGSSPPSLAPPPRDDDTVITCRGPLTMVPAPPDLHLPSPTASRLDLVGSPVDLRDPIGRTFATCATLRYDLPEGRLELIGSDEHGMEIDGPQLAAEGERFWLTLGRREGGFTGAGRTRFRTRAETGPGEPDGQTPERLRVRWNERMDLAFAEAADGGLGPVRRAAFHGAVRVEGRDLAGVSGTTPDATTTAAPGDNASPLPDAGTLECTALAVTFRRKGPVGAGAADGGSGREPNAASAEPETVEAEHLRATGDVHATDRRQSLWSGTLDVWFAAGAASMAAPMTEEEPRGARPPNEAERVVATEAVRMVLANGEQVFADRVELDAPRRTAILEGTNVRLVDGMDVIDRARHVTVDDASGTYVLAGPGRFRRLDHAVLPPWSPPTDPGRLDTVPERHEQLRVTWNDGVRITSPRDAAEADGANAAVGVADEARFRGAVTVRSPELRLDHADELVVMFTRGDDDVSTIDTIDARGDVRARGATDDSAIASDEVHVDLARDDTGAAVPTRLLASGRVHLTDGQQHLWTTQLVTEFRPAITPAPDVAADVGAAPAGFGRARVVVGEVEAVGGVELLLAGGERAYAERLVADGELETASLTGDRVLVVSDEFVLDRGTHLAVDRRSGRYEVLGAGVFYGYGTPLGVSRETARVPPPDVERPTTLQAVWTRSARYVEEPDGRGVLELSGDVHAVSQPTRREESTVDSGHLTLEFAAAPSGEDAAASRLTRLVAREAARLESRTWRHDDRAERPRVFYVSGDHIEHDQRTLEALVPGAGELLTRDDWPQGTGGADERAGFFSAQGTTLFRWTDQLHMTRLHDEEFLIAMTGDVECRHQDLEQQIATFTGQRLDAVVVRSGAAPATRGDRVGGALDLGGAMTARRLSARDGIYVQTPDRDVACDELDYDVGTGIAELGAAPGRMVYVRSRAGGTPMRRERIVWDMTTDTITVYGGTAAGVP